MKLPLSFVFVLLWPSMALAQSNSDRCKVWLLDLTGRTAAQVETPSGKELGTFDTVIAEEERTVRSYRLPKSKLFIFASVWYTDESMASEKGRDFISLQLLVSPKKTFDVLGSLQFADAELPFHDFDVGRVTMKFSAAAHKFIVSMECRKLGR